MVYILGHWFFVLRDLVRDPSRDPRQVAEARLRALYVAPGFRYRYLHSRAALALPSLRLQRFQRRLRRDARRMTVGELDMLLDAGWRERMTACWLIATGCRAELRQRLADDLAADPSGDSLDDHPLALASFGTARDAEILSTFLGRALLSDSELDGQAAAMAALLHLDQTLGTQHAQAFLHPGGAWESWHGSAEVDLTARQHLFVQELALVTGGRPDLRAQFIRDGVYPKGWRGWRSPPVWWR